MPSFPNIFLIMMDSTRRDALSCYGNPECTTPFLDSLAMQATLYQNAFSAAGYTLPSITSILSGLYLPASAGRIQQVAAEVDYVSEVLQKQGYKCHSISDNPFLNQKVLKGFDEVCYFDKRNFWKALHPLALCKGIVGWKQKFKMKDRFFLEQSAHLLRERGSHPLFLWMHFDTTHYPYTPPKAFLKMFKREKLSWEKLYSVQKKQILTKGFVDSQEPLEEEELLALKDLYQANVRYMDSVLESFVSRLERWGFLEDSLLIVAGDHGDFLGEHGLLGHTVCLYEELTQVPLLVKYPGETQGTKVTTLASLVDIFPTILDCLGLETPPLKQRLQGHSLRQLPPEREFVVSRYVFGEGFDFQAEKVRERYPQFQNTQDYLGEQIALRTATHKYISVSHGQDMLFDFSKKGEQENLVHSAPALAEEFREKLKTLDTWIPYRTEKEENFSPSPGDMDYEETVKKQLQALGYMDE